MGEKIKRAIISVYKKDGILELGRFLSDSGVEILSTSKTARLLSESGIPVTKIEDVTKFPEILGGRVKTLHPNIFAGILARRELAEDLRSIEDLKIKPIDLVVINLYPFAETIAKAGVTREEAIEMIDIGGPSMVRASAKNYKHVAVVTDPADYATVISEMRSGNGAISLGTRERLAQKAFKTTFEYDRLVSGYLEGSFVGESNERFPENMKLDLNKLGSLRYGENPHQGAALYSIAGWDLDSLAGVRPLQGKEISYNNLMDAQGAINAVRDIEGEYKAAIIKHTNPCGIARSEKSLLEAYKLARECDPISAFGGIVCFNERVDDELAQELNKLFTEVVIAPAYTEKAMDVFSKKKNLRVLKLDVRKSAQKFDLKLIDGGALLQELDNITDHVSEAKCVTEKKPSKEEMGSLNFAMSICKNVKSNSIVITNNNHSVGIGAGQTSRVDSCKIAIMKARTPLRGCVLASDAFFPFRDSIDLVAREGITAVIQPGGSIKDNEVIAACNEHGIAMIFTGKRHFKH